MLASDESENSICLFFDYIDEIVPVSSIISLCEDVAYICNIKASRVEISKSVNSDIRQIKHSTFVKNFLCSVFPSDIDLISVKGGGVDGSDISFSWEPMWVVSFERRGEVNSAFISIPHIYSEHYIDIAIVALKYIKSKIVSGFYYPTFLSPNSYFYGVTYNNAPRKIRLSDIESERNYLWRVYSKDRKKSIYVIREVYPFYMFNINDDELLGDVFKTVSSIGVSSDRKLFDRFVKVVEIEQDFYVGMQSKSHYGKLFVCDPKFRSRFFWPGSLQP